jgi:hypothetical protein
MMESKLPILLPVTSPLNSEDPFFSFLSSANQIIESTNVAISFREVSAYLNFLQVVYLC